MEFRKGCFNICTLKDNEVTWIDPKETPEVKPQYQVLQQFNTVTVTDNEDNVLKLRKIEPEKAVILFHNLLCEKAVAAED